MGHFAYSYMRTCIRAHAFRLLYTGTTRTGTLTLVFLDITLNDYGVFCNIVNYELAFCSVTLSSSAITLIMVSYVLHLVKSELQRVTFFLNALYQSSQKTLSLTFTYTFTPPPLDGIHIRRATQVPLAKLCLIQTLFFAPFFFFFPFRIEKY